MKLFIDTANIQDIETGLQSGCIRGITTNPSLLSKEPKSNYVDHLKKIVAVAAKQKDIAVSVEVFSDDEKEIIRQAEEFVSKLNYQHLAVKVHISHKGKHHLETIKHLSDLGIDVNCTACMTPLQATMAAASGARYVSLFYNRIRDGGNDSKYEQKRDLFLKDKLIEADDFNPNEVIRQTRMLIADYPKAEIIAGSIRSVVDIKQAGLAGAHIVTVPPKILWAALDHFKTDEAVELFFNDFSSWIS